MRQAAHIRTLKRTINAAGIERIQFLKDDQWLFFEKDAQSNTYLVHDWNNETWKINASFTAQDFENTHSPEGSSTSLVPTSFISASGKNHLILERSNQTSRMFYYFASDLHRFFPLPEMVQKVYGMYSDSHIVASALVPRKNDPTLFDNYLIALPITNILQQSDAEPVQYLFSEAKYTQEPQYLNIFDVKVGGTFVTWSVFEHGIPRELYIAKPIENGENKLAFGITALKQEQIFLEVKTNIVGKLFKNGEVSDIPYQRGLFIHAIEPQSNQILLETASLDIDYFLVKLKLEELKIQGGPVSTPYRASSITYEANDSDVIVMRMEIPTDLGMTDAYLVTLKSRWDEIQEERLNDPNFNAKIPTIIEMDGISLMRSHRQKEQYFSNWIRHGGAYVILHASGAMERGLNYSSSGKYGMDKKIMFKNWKTYIRL